MGPMSAFTHALVGNAIPLTGAPDRSAEIDAHGHIWRFNNAPNMTRGLQGARTTLLWLVNSGGSMRERLELDNFPDHPAVRATRHLAFPVHPAMLRRYHPEPDKAARAAGDRNDWTGPAIEHFGALGKAVTVLPATHYEAACEALGLDEDARRERFPSTGFLAAHWLLTEKADARARIYGFTWDGWDSHSWTAERDWFAAMEGQGRIAIVRDGGT